MYPASRSSTNSTAWPPTPTGCLVTSGKLMYYRVFREGLTGSPPRPGPHVSNCTSTLSCLSLDPQIGSTDWVLKLGSLMPQVHRHVYHRVLRLGPQTRSLYASSTLSSPSLDPHMPQVHCLVYCLVFGSGPRTCQVTYGSLGPQT